MRPSVSELGLTPGVLQFWVLPYWKATHPVFLLVYNLVFGNLGYCGETKIVRFNLHCSTLGNLVFLSGQSMISPSFGSYILHISLRDTEVLVMSFSPTEESLRTRRAWTQVLAGKWRRNLLLDLKRVNQVQRDIAVVSTVIAASH